MYPILLLCLAGFTNAQYLRPDTVSVLQVYPPLSDPGGDDDRIPIYLALMQSFGGGYTSAGVIPGIQIALDEINANSSILPGYKLHYYLTDTQCNHQRALDQFIHQVSEPPVKIAAIGGGCSLATEPTAGISHYWQIPQLSCTSSSPNLGDRDRYKRHFAMIRSEESLAYGYFGIIKKFEWRSVTIFFLDVGLFEVSTFRLAELLKADGISYSVKSFTVRDGIEQLGDNPFDDGNRIFILEMYHTYAAQLLCKAYRAGVRYPQYVLIYPAWYEEMWWNDTELDFNCTLEERESVIQQMLSIYQYEFIEDADRKADSGMVGGDFFPAYDNHFNNTLFKDVPFNNLSQTCYDGTWALALALNKTIQDIDDDTDLNNRAQEEAMLNATFQIENFTYNNTSILEVLFGYLEKTQFRGITGDVMFDAFGIRVGGRIQVFQNRNQNGNLEPMKVADVRNQSSNASFVYVSGEKEETVWPDGVPYDGVPEEEVVTVHVSVTAIFVFLATAGLVFTVLCLVFNFTYRKKKLIQLSSPNLNYVIGVGAILLYFDAYILVTPARNETVATVLCNATLWLTSFGYSLCFGTIMAKMMRVFYIFNNPTPKKKKVKDLHLFVFIGALITVDLLILVIYTFIQGVNGNINAQKSVNTERPSDEEGVLRVEYQYFIYVCSSNHRRITLGILYGYKALLQILAVILALKTRKVQVKGLDDSKYIIAATYLSSLVLLAVIIMTYTAYELINTYAVVTSASFILGSTAIIAIVFIPKMVVLYKDPEGTTVFKTTNTHIRSQPNDVDDNNISTLKQRVTELDSKEPEGTQEAVREPDIDVVEEKL